MVRRASLAQPGRPNARVRILDGLMQSGAASRAELARRTALAPSTVSTVVGELAEAGVVVELAVVGELAEAGVVVEPAPVTQAAEPNLGRPPVLVALDRSAG